jgi:hypothetical protein
MILRSRGSDGKVVMRRPKFDPGAYSVPAQTLDGLRSYLNLQSYEVATAGPEGALLGYTLIESSESGGHTWHVLQANGSEHCIEVEVVDGAMTRIEAVPPERAWQIALERDQRLRPGMIYD